MAKRDPRVDEYIEKSAAFARPILRHLRRVVHLVARRSKRRSSGASRTSFTSGSCAAWPRSSITAPSGFGKRSWFLLATNVQRNTQWDILGRSHPWPICHRKRL